MRLASAEHAKAFLRSRFAGRSDEAVAVAYLDARQRVLKVTFSDHERDHAELPIRRILADALSFEAAAIVVAHNHPSGDGRPSQADMAATRRLADVAAAIGVRLLDHLIFAGGGCFSMRAAGLL